MATLLLNLSGVLQSWGDSSRFTIRGTRSLPTKSGIIGLLAAAQGRRRTDPIEDLVALRFGVREDQSGSLIRDFQTAIDWRTGKSKPLSHRHYLADAKFLAVIEGEHELLSGIADAIRSPVFPLYLGRRACPPGERLVIGVEDMPLEEALNSADWLAREWYRRQQSQQPLLPWSRDARMGEQVDATVQDAPLSFDPRHRRYAWRDVVHGWTQKENPLGHATGNGHDALALLGGE